MRFLILTTVLLSGIAQGAADKPVVIPKGETVTGLCVGVHDGDSMTLLIATPEGKRQPKIRMDAIDAPELGQPVSNRAAGEAVNAALLEAGMAWHFAKYDTRQSMADRHEAARRAGKGLWADPKPITPWE